MNQDKSYPIGTPGQKWGNDEKQCWLSKQQVKRSYQDEVIAKLKDAPASLETVNYGQLTYKDKTFELCILKSANIDLTKPFILITGGVHGYETSGVQGAIRFAQTQVEQFPQFNFVIAPCISPWGYETINRWNPNAIDPNRSFYQPSPAQESALIMAYVNQLKTELNIEFLAHFDLHETTDTDNSEFRPALAARDASVQTSWNIPDGFYLVGDSENPQKAFQKAIIEAVEQVTHIAPADQNNQLIGKDLDQFGVINYPTKKLGLCASLTGAAYCTTTEVYPDSDKVDDENCIRAQVAAISGGLKHLLSL
ncbi:M14 family metallocarboxypeptidase [Thalassotalea aquiviva]|uniref:M14 family metallopeptidase n=1 Tax=Thalassotalea aquiviva TaxID=3242415 RepID=UPI00352A2E71